MKIIVVGGSGLIGSRLVKKFGEQGHQAIAASSKSGVNTLTGEGLAEVLKNAQVVVDVSNSPSFADDAVMEFFRTSTGNLLTYEAAAGVDSPLNGTVEVAGAEVFRFDEFIRQNLRASNDPREVVTDPHARYFGAELSERSLVTGRGGATWRDAIRRVAQTFHLSGT